MKNLVGLREKNTGPLQELPRNARTKGGRCRRERWLEQRPEDDGQRKEQSHCERVLAVLWIQQNVQRQLLLVKHLSGDERAGGPLAER